MNSSEPYISAVSISVIPSERPVRPSPLRVIPHFPKQDAKVTWYPIPTGHARARRMQIDDQDRVLVTEYRASKVALFDTKTEKFAEYKLPDYTFPYRANFDKK
jgi:streptogramin lyase